jgi:hypothetical protein
MIHSCPTHGIQKEAGCDCWNTDASKEEKYKNINLMYSFLLHRITVKYPKLN